MTLLEVEALTSGYGPVRVLHGLDFRVDIGQIVVMLGANGAGKTTTLRALSGILPARGRVRFNGVGILGRKSEQIARLGVGHVPQGRGTFGDLTVEENLRAGAYLCRRDDTAAAIAHWYSFFPRLGERRTQLAASLSGGEQQMLAIARALVSQPKLLLLDEPSLGLSPAITREVFDGLLESRGSGETAILMVEQNAELALGIASFAFLLEAGTIVASCEADTMLTDDRVRRAYLGY